MKESSVLKAPVAVSLGLLILLIIGCSQNKGVTREIKSEVPGVRSILIEQLKNSHSNKDWYVPISIAIDGLTAEQANHKDSTGNHSISELVSHLVFWNERILFWFHDEKAPEFNEDNELTFITFSEAEWASSVRKLDSIQTVWEKSVANATDEQLRKWSSSVANISAHNAYHTGQIVYIRKQNGWWDASKGVK